MKKNIAIVTMLMFAGCSFLLGQNLTSIRGIAMGGANVVVSRGTDALGVNPANLGLLDQKRVELSLLPLTVRFTSEFLNLELYNNYFTGVPDQDGDGERDPKVLTEKEKQEILDAFPNDVSGLGFNLEMQPVALTWTHLPFIGGGLGFSVTNRFGFNMGLSKEYFRFFMNGFRAEGSLYNTEGSYFSGWNLLEYNISYGRQIPVFWKFKIPRDLYAGIGVRIIQGTAYIETQKVATVFGNVLEPSSNQYRLRAGFEYQARISSPKAFSKFTLGDPQIDGNPVTEPGGSGVGIDIGLSSEIISGVRVALSMTDIGSITWENNTFQYRGYYMNDFIDFAEFDNQSDTVKTALEGVESKIDPFETELPTKLRIGAALDSRRFPYLKFIPGQLNLAGEIVKGFNNSFGNSDKLLFAFGLEYRLIPVLPFRTGIALGGNLPGAYWSMGLGLDLWVWEINFATENIGVLFFPNSVNLLSYSMGMKFKF